MKTSIKVTLKFMNDNKDEIININQDTEISEAE